MDSFAAFLKDVAPAPAGAKDSICCGQ